LTVTGTSEGTNDGHGHGTWLAGFVMANTYGVARSANTWAVKVLNDSGVGSTSGIIAGINWSINHKNTWKRKTVILMTVIGTSSFIIDSALQSVSCPEIYSRKVLPIMIIS
jgi:subtilisin family serine protease